MNEEAYEGGVEQVYQGVNKTFSRDLTIKFKKMGQKADKGEDGDPDGGSMLIFKRRKK